MIPISTKSKPNRISIEGTKERVVELHLDLIYIYRTYKSLRHIRLV